MISLVGLHHPAAVRLLPRPARQAPEGAPPPLAPAGEHVVHHRRGPRRGPGPSRARGEGAALPRPLRRGRVRRGRRRARLPARGRQPGLPRRRDRRAGRRGRRQPVRLQGRRHPAQRRRLRLLQQPDAVRRLRPGRALRPRRDGAVLLQHHRLRRRLAHRGQAGPAWRASSSPPSTTRPSPAGRTETYDLKVNHPLTIGGTDVFLIGHGYAPVITIRDGEGEVTKSGPVVFLPTNAQTFESFGVVKAPFAEPGADRPRGRLLPDLRDGRGRRRQPHHAGVGLGRRPRPAHLDEPVDRRPRPPGRIGLRRSTCSTRPTPPRS